MSSPSTTTYTISDGNKYLTSCGPSSDPIQILTPTSSTVVQTTSCYLWEMAQLSTSSLAECKMYHYCSEADRQCLTCMGTKCPLGKKLHTTSASCLSECRFYTCTSPYGTCTLCSQDTEATCSYVTSNCNGECQPEYYCNKTTSSASCERCSGGKCGGDVATYITADACSPTCTEEMQQYSVRVYYEVERLSSSCRKKFQNQGCAKYYFISPIEGPEQAITHITLSNDYFSQYSDPRWNAKILVQDSSPFHSYALEIIYKDYNDRCGLPCGPNVYGCPDPFWDAFSLGPAGICNTEIQLITIVNNTPNPLTVVYQLWNYVNCIYRLQNSKKTQTLSPGGSFEINYDSGNSCVQGASAGDVGIGFK